MKTGLKKILVSVIFSALLLTGFLGCKFGSSEGEEDDSFTCSLTYDGGSKKYTVSYDIKNYEKLVKKWGDVYIFYFSDHYIRSKVFTVTSATGTFTFNLSDIPSTNPTTGLICLSQDRYYNSSSSSMKSVEITFSEATRGNEPEISVTNIYHDKSLEKYGVEYEFTNYNTISANIDSSYTWYVGLYDSKSNKIVAGSDKTSDVLFYSDSSEREDIKIFAFLGSYASYYGYSSESDFLKHALPSENPVKVNFPKEYWGTWIQMDTGTKFYINSTLCYSSDFTVKTTNKNGFEFDGNNILKKDGKYYFRKGGGARDFTATVSGFTSTINAFKRAAAKDDLKIVRENENNPSDTETVNADQTGKVAFNDAIADDNQQVSISDTNGDYVKNTFGFVPTFSGDYMGTIPLVEKGNYGFKTSYEYETPNAQGIYYVKNSYKVKFKLKNVGDKNCGAGTVTINSTDSNIRFGNSTDCTWTGLSGNYQTMEPGVTTVFTNYVKYDGAIEDEYVDVTLSIVVNDAATDQTWNDSVILRFYRGYVNLNIAGRSFNSSSYPSINGFIIYGDGRSQRFSYDISYYEKTVAKSIKLPWSKTPYYLVFSGAYETNDEICYGFDISGNISSSDIKNLVTTTYNNTEINAYEPNNTIGTAGNINVYTDGVVNKGSYTFDTKGFVKAYLTVGDIDYYKIDIKDIDESKIKTN